jgi:hypothetical protein
MDALNDSSNSAAKAQSSVFKALKYPFSGVSGMLQRRKERAVEQKQQQQRSAQSVEMLDFTTSTSSYHRKTQSDSSVSTTDSSEGL